MKRSKNELKALEAAYETSLLVKSFVANIISGSDDEDDVENDKKWLSDAETYVKWYESNF